MTEQTPHSPIALPIVFEAPDIKQALRQATLHLEYNDFKGGADIEAVYVEQAEGADFVLDFGARPAESVLRVVYRERAHLVALLAALFPAHIGPSDPDEPAYEVVIVETPYGQVSWHIARDDLDLFACVPRTDDGSSSWDGHSTDEKYDRLRLMRESLNRGRTDAPCRIDGDCTCARTELT